MLRVDSRVQDLSKQFQLLECGFLVFDEQNGYAPKNSPDRKNLT